MGPSFKNKKVSNNVDDFYTVEDVDEIDYYYYFSFKDNDGFVYTFNIVSIHSLLQKRHTENPYNRCKFSNEIINSEIKIFNKNFDEAFLHIYPDFVDKLNLLLETDSRVKYNPNSKELSTEIRIFALIRLGITSSSQISKILRYSVNTIYNYRVKVKNTAIDRESFESNIISIV